MKYILSGVETNNKGAELMLYAILQEIAKKDPAAVVYLPYFAVRQGLGYIKTNLQIQFCPYGKALNKIRYVIAILRRLNIEPTFLYETFNVKNADYFLDASGFCFSDQLPMKNLTIDIWNKTLTRQKASGAKIIFLPQAYGPAEKDSTKTILNIINETANLIFVREQTSWNYLEKSGVVDKKKMRLNPDFTITVKGTVPNKYRHLADGVCIIPNNRMIEKGGMSFEQYAKAIKAIVGIIKRNAKMPFILCHEEKSDMEIVKRLDAYLGREVEIVIGLNALEVKGIISQSYLCISSRFHGVVSSLNSTVPCLSTSWSHKYSELYNDYGLENCVIDFSKQVECHKIIEEFLDSKKNVEIRNKLEESVLQIEKKVNEMWSVIWNL